MTDNANARGHARVRADTQACIASCWPAGRAHHVVDQAAEQTEPYGAAAV